MAANSISTSTPKSDRRNKKLAIAATKRQLANTPGYRKLNTIVGSHTAFVGTATGTVSGTASPIDGHPWKV